MDIRMLNHWQIDIDRRQGKAFTSGNVIAYDDGDMFIDRWPTTPQGQPRYRVATSDERASLATDPEYIAWRVKADAMLEQARRTEELRATTEATGRPVYVRFGKAPASGHSWNHRDNRAEPGVSVYQGWILPGRRVVIDLGNMDVVSSMFIANGDRPLYTVTGTLAGTGSDGEPCLQNITQRRYIWESIEFV